MVFKKGESGNLNGRPQAMKTPLSEDTLKKLKSADTIEGMVDVLMEGVIQGVGTAEDALRALKEIAPYVKPKLSSIKSEIQQDTTINIRIEGVMNMSVDGDGKRVAQDVTPKLDSKQQTDDVMRIIDGDFTEVEEVAPVNKIDPDLGI